MESGWWAVHPRVPGGRFNPLTRVGRGEMGTQICVSHLILVQEVSAHGGQGQSCIPLQVPPACRKQSWDLSIPFSRVPGGKQRPGRSWRIQGKMEPGGPALQRRDNVMC